MTSIYVSSDGSDKESHQVRSYSTAEFYCRAGFKKTQQRLLKLKKQDAQRIGESIEAVESRLSTRKTANMNSYKLYLTDLFANLPRLLKFYDERMCALKILNYIGRQRAEAEMVNIMVTGGEKLKKKTKGKERKGKKWKPSALQTDNKIPLIGFGAANFASTMKGKLAGLAERCRHVLRKAERQGRLVMIDIDDYLTSQVCSKCSTRDLKAKQLGDDEMYAVKVCNNCHTVWQRDTNASRNIHHIALQCITSGNRPPQFKEGDVSETTTTTTTLSQ
jgi:transposase